MELALKFWDTEKRGSVLVPRAMFNLGFSAKSGHGVAALSAMIKFGLLEDEGSGPSRKVKLTDTAIALLNPSTPNKEEITKTCALAPTIHADLWKKFGADGGSAGAIHDYLTFERGFFEEAAKALVGQFKDTIAFAKLTETDKVNETATSEETGRPGGNENPLPFSPPTVSPGAVPATQDQKGATPPPAAPPISPSAPTSAPPRTQMPLGTMNPDVKYFAIPTDIGDAHIPMGMSEEDFTLFGAALKLFKSKIVKASRYPIGAIWHNADHDKPVTIIGEMGERDGVKYYESQSGTGIPENELTFAS